MFLILYKLVIDIYRLSQKQHGYSALNSGLLVKYSMKRAICPTCNERPVAVCNIIKGKRYYRTQCDSCIRKGKKLKPKAPAWVRAGYKKKERCELCGFKAHYPTKQLRVFYVDGNLKNNNWSNLKTVCLNCQVEVTESQLPWKQCDLVPDF